MQYGTKTTILEELNMNNIVMEQEVMGEEHRATETGEQMCEDDQVTWVIREDDHTDHLDYPDH